MRNISVDGYLIAQGFNKYSVPNEKSDDGTLWVREKDGIRLQVFTSSRQKNTYLVEISINKPFETTGLMDSRYALTGEFAAGPLTEEQILNNGIITKLQKIFEVNNLM